MKIVRSYPAWVLCAAVVLGGCGKMDWDWWKKPKTPANTSAQTTARDPNTEVRPEEALRLKDENKTLRDQLQELHARDLQLADQVKELKRLYEGQLIMIDTLKEAPDERDKARAQVKELTAEIERLRQEIVRLGGVAPAPVPQPTPILPVAIPPTMNVPPPAAPAPTPSATIPPVQVVPVTPGSSSAPALD